MADIVAQGEAHDAVLAASANGREDVMRLLLRLSLQNRAVVNAQEREHGKARPATPRGRHEAVVLLFETANVNARAYGDALRAASRHGHEAVVRLLLEKGADVNLLAGEYGNALQAASVCGFMAVVRLLLERGADVNAQGGYYGIALQAASYMGHEAIVLLLLETGSMRREATTATPCRPHRIAATRESCLY